jgi:hypothetical protein
MGFVQASGFAFDANHLDIQQAFVEFYSRVEEQTPPFA